MCIYNSFSFITLSLCNITEFVVVRIVIKIRQNASSEQITQFPLCNTDTFQKHFHLFSDELGTFGFHVKKLFHCDHWKLQSFNVL